ncbi:MAG: hypothetical protein IT521_15360 [Burkholderiales bacterium]|nr:hypothetical protein [Burkholderiales bacterium]
MNANVSAVNSTSVLTVPNPGARGGDFYFAKPQGHNADILGAIHAIQEAATSFYRNWSDVQADHAPGTHARQDKTNASCRAALKALGAQVPRLERVRSEIVERKAGVSVAAEYTTSRPWEWVFDLATAAQVLAMDAGRRRMTVRTLADDPGPNWLLGEAMVRVPVHLTGITLAEQDEIETRMFQRLRPDKYKALVDDIADLNAANGMLRKLALAIGGLCLDTAIFVTENATLHRHILTETPISWRSGRILADEDATNVSEPAVQAGNALEVSDAA